MKYKNIQELIADMTGRPNVWTAIEEIGKDGVIINGYWTREAYYTGNGVIVWGGKTKKETKENIQEALQRMKEYE